MSGLAIFDVNGKPVVDAYVEIVDEIVMDAAQFENFTEARGPKKKARKLRNLVRGTGATLTHVANGAEEEIDPDHVSVDAEVDWPAMQSGGRARYTVPLPPAHQADLNYLGKYAQEIVDLYNTGVAADKDKAHRFMFGVMMLTRCR